MSLLHTLLAREEESGPAPACETGNEYDGNMGVRISSIFVLSLIHI